MFDTMNCGHETNKKIQRATSERVFFFDALLAFLDKIQDSEDAEGSQLTGEGVCKFYDL